MTSASTATTQATNAATSATAAASSATSAASSAAAAAAALDSFDDRYLGAKTSNPTLDNDGNALVQGALYYRSTAPIGMKVYDGAQWIEASAAQQASLVTFEYVATAGQTSFSGNDANGVSLSYTVGNVLVSVNGVRLRPGDDFTATNGTSVVLTSAASVGDEVLVDAFRTFEVANTYTQAQVDAADALKLNAANPSYTGALTGGTGVVNFGSGQFYKDASGNVGFGTTVAPGPNGKGISIYATDYPRISMRNATTGDVTSDGFQILGVGLDVYFQNQESGSLIFNVNSVEGMRLDQNRNLKFDSGYGSSATAYGCRAWVNFNGTGTVAIRASGNVSSITDNGAGLYTINFTTAMPDANYSVVGSAGLGSAVVTRLPAPGGIISTSSVQVDSTDAAQSNRIDISSYSVAIFR